MVLSFMVYGWVSTARSLLGVAYIHISCIIQEKSFILHFGTSYIGVSYVPIKSALIFIQACDMTVALSGLACTAKPRRIYIQSILIQWLVFSSISN